MKLAQSVKLGAWLLIAMNLLTAFGSIWIFMRMAPAIKVIIAQNEVSLEASEKMLAALVAARTSGDRTDGKLELFRNALNRAENNVTEKEEPAFIEEIVQHHKGAFNGDELALAQTLGAIVKLAEVNREAMRRADARAQQLGYAGAWGVVFMAALTFMVGMIFLRSMKKNLSEPMRVIDTVVSAFRRGDRMQRCSMGNPSKSIRQIFSNINELLDMQ